MRTRIFLWLIAAIAVVAMTFALASLIVVLAPNDPSTAAASLQQQVLEPKLESMAESHKRAK
jgi:hypothetical protein